MIDFEVFQEDMRTGEPTKIGTVFIPTYDCDSMYKGSFNLISGAKLYVE